MCYIVEVVFSFTYLLTIFSGFIYNKFVLNYFIEYFFYKVVFCVFECGIYILRLLDVNSYLITNVFLCSWWN